MKYPELIGKCKTCIGCSLLELGTFKGKYRCQNFVDGGKTNDIQVYDRYKTSKLK